MEPMAHKKMGGIMTEACFDEMQISLDWDTDPEEYRRDRLRYERRQ